MAKAKKMIASAVAAVVSAGLAMAAVPAQGAVKKMEKCYGIVKKGKNDCGARHHACAGLSKVDNDPQEWIFLPKGSCHKIVGGSTTKKTS